MSERWRFWRVHLTTMVVFAACVAGSVWLNGQSTDKPRRSTYTRYVGWPMAYFVDSGPMPHIGPQDVDAKPRVPAVRTTVMSYEILLCNIAILLLGAAIVAAVWELIIRKLERDRSAPIQFRTHLLTAILLMILASVLLGGNLMYRNSFYSIGRGQMRVRGWPFEFQELYGNGEVIFFSKEWIAWNVLVGVAMLLALWAISEYLIRSSDELKAMRRGV
jgi:hypothetical protein